MAFATTQSWSLLRKGIGCPSQRATSVSQETPELKIIESHNKLLPYHCDIEVTEACNLKCPFCYADGGHGKSYVSLENMQKIFDELVDVGVTSLDLTGGEFFVHPNAMEILQLAVARFPKIGLLTNGTLIPNEAIDFIASHTEQFFLNVSIDSVNPELHDRIRGMEGAFDITTRNVKRLTDRGVKVRIATVIFEENMWELSDLAELTISLGAVLFNYNFVEGFGRGAGFKTAHGVQFSDEYGEYVTEIISKYHEILPIIPKTQIDDNRTNCGAGITRISVAADGNIRPCLLFDKTEMFGSLVEEPLQKILGSSNLMSILDLCEPSESHGCPPECKNLMECKHCYVRGFKNGLSIVNGKPTYCCWIRENGLMEYANTLLASTTP